MKESYSFSPAMHKLEPAEQFGVPETLGERARGTPDRDAGPETLTCHIAGSPRESQAKCHP